MIAMSSDLFECSSFQQPKPSWYGESVGHYEGDVLVVDTIGLNDKTFVDNFRRPHSAKLHVVERYQLTDGGKFFDTEILIDDPEVFLSPLHVAKRVRGAAWTPLGTNGAAWTAK